MTIPRNKPLARSGKLRQRSTRKPTRPRTVNGVTTFDDGRQVCDQRTKSGQAEYERRRFAMAERQNHLCAICGLGLRDITFEHEAGRGMGGGHRDDRIELPDGTWMNAAIHSACQAKGSIRYTWLPDRSRFVPLAEAAAYREAA